MSVSGVHGGMKTTLLHPDVPVSVDETIAITLDLKKGNFVIVQIHTFRQKRQKIYEIFLKRRRRNRS